MSNSKLITERTNEMLADKYQQKTEKEHILSNPDTYIGSIENIETDQWILDSVNNKIIEKNISYIPGLFKLFDEGIVNCRDHVVRMQKVIDEATATATAATATAAKAHTNYPVTNIEVTIQDDGTIIMMNDGNGIDVIEHPTYKIWIPELIFGHLRTSTNYNKEEKKLTGGKNGFGFKLVLIWSVSGSVETVDHTRGLKYYQEFNNNLNEIGQPKVTKCSTSKPYTKITFKPDYTRLGIDGLNEDNLALLKKRVYDISAITDKSIKVKYNSQLVPIKNFQEYVSMYIGSKDVAPRVYEEGGERWEYIAALSPKHEFTQISFVNGIYTSKGGKHVEYILNQILKKLVAFIEKKKKIVVTSASIKEQIILFVRCDIENPAFDSQTKDYMNTPSSKFGSSCTVSDKFIEKLAKMGIMDTACAVTELKGNKAIAKKTDGAKTKNISGIPKLVDANWAGTEKSKHCMFIISEGDSAKAGILSGLSPEDRNTIGVYPAKGKVLNVRGENREKISNNKEITEIIKIMGLEFGKEYKTQEDIDKNLRYSRILVMCDSDVDGHHIKGLIINLFHSEWPSLVKIQGFLGYMNTPILKARKGNKVMSFYNNGEYEFWKKENNDCVKGWDIKYYKGLGTSTSTEFKEYFKEKKLIEFQHTGLASDTVIDMIFNKKKANERKEWLGSFNRNDYLDTRQKIVPYEEFINKEFIQFSFSDCDRSLPNIMDGLKTSHRKIIYSAFKKNLTKEIKIAQFSGYISEHSCYHHGEQSLQSSCVALAQNFVGSNNINLLEPIGQFGTRICGGSDSASPRYIFTKLNPLTRAIYRIQDDHVLNYLDDDGQLVEPQFYAPIIPMLLVNGSTGIGTGYSTDIMCYDPKTIVRYLENKLGANANANNTSAISSASADVIDFKPYYRGFNGVIQRIAVDKYLFKGIYKKIGPDKIHVTELPVGLWTDVFKETLESLKNVDKEKEKGKDKGKEKGKDKDDNSVKGEKVQPLIKDIVDLSNTSNVDFTITFHKGKLNELEMQQLPHGCNELERVLKLFTTNTTTNMHAFNASDKLTKYEKVSDIIDEYFVTRMEIYKKRQDYLIQALEKELVLLTNKTNYIKEVLVGTVDLRSMKKEMVSELLKSKNYTIIDEDDDYKYLTKLPMDAVTQENVDKLMADFQNKTNELQRIKTLTLEQVWLGELAELKKLL